MSYNTAFTKSESFSIMRQILFVWNYLDWGGAQIYFLAIMKEAKANWKIKVILPRKSPRDIVNYIEQIGVEYEFIDVWIDLKPAHGIAAKIVRQWRRIHSEAVIFLHLLKYNLKNTVVHIEVPPWQSWILLTALCLRTSVFVTMHNSVTKTSDLREKIWKARMRWITGFKNFNLFTSNQDTKNSLQKWLAPAAWDKVQVTYTSINPAEIDEVAATDFDKNDLCRKHNLPADKFLVLCVGQFIDRKGRWVFLEAAEKVLKSGVSDVEFVWLTQKYPTDAEVERINSYNLGGAFHLILSKNVGAERSGILNFFRLADTYVLASLVEGLPIALLEAMALEKCSISTNVNAIPEAVINLETGILIEPNDSDALAEAIVLLKNDPKLRKKLAENGRRHVVESFDERVMARTALGCYERALSK